MRQAEEAEIDKLMTWTCKYSWGIKTFFFFFFFPSFFFFSFLSFFFFFLINLTYTSWDPLKHSVSTSDKPST